MAYNRTAALALLLLCATAAAVPSSSAISCAQVDGYVSGCINYLRRKGPLPPACCKGVSSLNSVANTTPARQAACGCLKDAAIQIPGILPDLAAGLPQKCGVNLPYHISTSINCNTVN